MSDIKQSGKKALWVPAVGAIGVVFGDIGTSPLYVLQECFRGTGNCKTAKQCQAIF